MGHGIGAGLVGDGDLAHGDERPGDRRAEEVDALVEGIGPEHRPHEVRGKLLAQILDEDLVGAHHGRLGACGLEILALSEIRRERHHLALPGVLEPAQDDRRVESSRVGEDDFPDIAHDDSFMAKTSISITMES